MLLPADKELVLRDPGLPGLGMLLDDERLAAWLGDQRGEPVRWRTRYLRYKQGTSCVVAGDLEIAGRTRAGFASAHASDSLEKLTKSLRRAPAGSVVGADPAHGLVAGSTSVDRDLRALALLDDDRRLRRVLRRLLTEHAGIRGAQVRTLRYKPQRRWVGLVQLRGGPALVLRVYRPGAAGPAVAAIRACAASCGTPHLLGEDPARGVAAVEYVPGGVLPLTSGADGAGLDAIRSAGAALARMHGSRTPGLDSRSGGDGHAVLSAADQLVALLPDQADDVHRLATRIAGRLLSVDQVRVPIHGDFSLDQVIVEPSGTARLIDLDEAHLGDPAADLACATAALVRDAVLGRVEDETSANWLGALHEGYAAVTPLPPEDRLAAHTAAHLLRRAVEPFRLRQTGDWPAAARELLGRAGRIVDSAGFMEGAR